MTYFSNGTDAEIYQAAYCFSCQHYKPGDGSLGCPVLNMHFDHNRDEAWKPYLDEMIPPAPGPTWHGECAFYSEVNMKPDRLYTPPPPTWSSLLRRAMWQLRQLAESSEVAADFSLLVDQHASMAGEPAEDTGHVCDASCPDETVPHSTDLWLNKQWAEDEADAIEGFLAKYNVAVDPEAEAMKPTH